MSRESSPRLGRCSFIAAALLLAYSTFAASAQESFALSTFPTPTRKPDGSREITKDTNIAGRWRSQSGATYACSQTGKGFACRAEIAIQDADLKAGDIAFSGSIYEHVAIAIFHNRYGSVAGVHFCPRGYFDNTPMFLRVSDDAKTMRGELLMWHRDESCKSDGATIQEAVLKRLD